MSPNDKNLPYVDRPYKGVFRVSSRFGVVEKLRKGRKHKGIDFAVPVNTPLFACFDGVIVSKPDTDGNGAGNRVLIYNYARNLYALYFHMSNFVKDYTYSPIKTGELVGWSGNSGHSSGPHLHFELRRISDNVSLEPLFTDEYTLSEARQVDYEELA